MGCKECFSWIVWMYVNKCEEIDIVEVGDIVVVMGIDCVSGDMFVVEVKMCMLESMFVFELVIKVVINIVDCFSGDKFGKVLVCFCKEDLIFVVNMDEEMGEVIIVGMGELYLDVYIECICCEYKIDVEVSLLKVFYCEMVIKEIDFNYKYKK